VILQEQLRKAGAEVRLTPIEFNVWLDRARTGKFDAVIGAWQIDLPPTGLRELWGSAGVGGSNYGRYTSPAFDSLIARAAGATDLIEARRLWHQAVDAVNQDAPAVWLFSPTMLAGLNRRIEHVTIRPDEWWATLWMWTAGRR
jgi:dipeptide transport system substrate-binding protein